MALTSLAHLLISRLVARMKAKAFACTVLLDPCGYSFRVASNDRSLEDVPAVFRLMAQINEVA